MATTERELTSVSVCPDCGDGWTFDFAARSVYCRTCEPKGRYCDTCDRWMRHRDCPACGMPTIKADK